MHEESRTDDGDGLPNFHEGWAVLVPRNLRYNPANDVIFPSVIAAASLPTAQAAYYLYYAPHDTPGGICLAFADHLGGPWTEHANNPVIGASWPSHYMVDHVSSPHAIWREDRRELWMYYHGSNDCTRWSTSTDGITFTHGGEAVHAAVLGMDGASYARVFPSPFRGTKAFLMVLLLYKYMPDSWEQFERFGLYGAWSDDGIAWDVVPTPILGHEQCAPGEFVGSPTIFSAGDAVFLAYHLDRPGPRGSLTDVYAVAIDDHLRLVGTPRLLCDRHVFGPNNARIADPYVFRDGESWHLFGAIGPRLRQQIGWTIGG